MRLMTVSCSDGGSVWLSILAAPVASVQLRIARRQTRQLRDAIGVGRGRVRALVGRYGDAINHLFHQR